MGILRTLSVVLALWSMVFSPVQSVVAAPTPLKRGHSDLEAPIDPSARDWVEKQLIDGQPIVLSNSYLFQVMKAIAQENQKSTEENLLSPLLKQTLKGLVRTGEDPESRRLFEVPLLILDDSPGIEVSKDVLAQAEAVRQNPLFKPRGHYTDSEELKRYFQAMQYLSKATVDVAINPQYFPFPKDMLYPVETIESVVKTFREPKNKSLLRNWLLIHAFYSQVNGPADLPTFKDMVLGFKQQVPTRERVQTWAKAHSLPKLNPERGIGIQPFGERFSLHEKVIDDFKKKYFKDDTPRETIAEMLRFENLAEGDNTRNNPIHGLAALIAGHKNPTYYSATLRLILLGTKGWKHDRRRLNFFAASITSLAEQTTLMTKTSILVQKSVPDKAKLPSGLKLYFEPGSQRFLRGLSKASSAMVAVCKKVRRDAPRGIGRPFDLIDPGSAFISFAGLATCSKPLVTHSALWKAHGRFITKLVRKPCAVVDVFQLKDRSGKLFFYQWGTAPFVRQYGKRNPGSRPMGMEMVFFEGWSDEILPGSDGPLNNLDWEKRIRGGSLGRLHSILPIRSKEAR